MCWANRSVHWVLWREEVVLIKFIISKVYVKNNIFIHIIFNTNVGLLSCTDCFSTARIILNKTLAADHTTLIFKLHGSPWSQNIFEPRWNLSKSCTFHREKKSLSPHSTFRWIKQMRTWNELTIRIKNGWNRWNIKWKKHILKRKYTILNSWKLFLI